MKMIYKKNKWYKGGWCQSYNGRVAIGLSLELFKRMKIQVLWRDDRLPDDRGWSVVREYVTYEQGLMFKCWNEIINNINNIKPKDIKGWKDLENLLPVNNKKYLEDKYEKK